MQQRFAKTILTFSLILPLAACDPEIRGGDSEGGGATSDLPASCAGDVGSTGAVVGEVERMQAVGDSILGWNKEESASIPDVTGEVLGVPMRNHATGGATLGGDDGIGSLYEPDGESHVLVNGGGNDFAEDCTTERLDGLISEDLSSGLMVELVDDIAANGAQAVIVGYYLPSNRETGCELFEPLLRRYRQLGETRDEVTYVCTLDVITPDTPDLYADEVHPSVAGSAAVGEAVAAHLTR